MYWPGARAALSGRVARSARSAGSIQANAIHSGGRRRHDSRRLRGDVRASRQAGHALPGRVSLRRSARTAGFHVRSAGGDRPPARRSVSDGGGDRVGGARARRRPRLHADSAGSGRCDDARGRVRSVQDDRESRARGRGGGNEARSEDRSRGGHARPHGGAGLPAVLQRQDRRAGRDRDRRGARSSGAPRRRVRPRCGPRCAAARRPGAGLESRGDVRARHPSSDRHDPD